MSKKEYSFRAVAIMAVITLVISFVAYEMPEYWGEDVITFFFVLAVISGIRTAHMGVRAISG